MMNTGTEPTSVGLLINDNGVSTQVCGQSRIDKQVADLQWQIDFTQMKLNDWQKQECCRWMKLVSMQEQAKRKLLAVAS